MYCTYFATIHFCCAKNNKTERKTHEQSKRRN